MSGVLHGVLASLKAAAAAVTDAYFKYVSLLLNTNSTNGAQNNTFLDSSTNAFSITRNGNTTQGNFSPFSQTGWSNYFDGNVDSLQCADNAAFEFGSGNFTLEAWICPTAYATLNNGQYNADIISKDQTALRQFGFYISGTASSYTALNFIGFSNNTTFTIVTGTQTFTLGVWYHVAAVRNGNNVYLYVDGVQVNSTTAFSQTIQDTASVVYIGARNFDVSNQHYFPGYISNLRVVKGTAVYTGNFTPPTAPLTAISGTSLLTCQSNRFIDNSSNAFAITRNGDVSVQAFSPFNPTAAWSASTNGGSGYFDGAGDSLTTPYSTTAFDWFTTGTDYTIEASVYPISLTTWSANDYAPSLVGNMELTGYVTSWSFGPTPDGTIRLHYDKGGGVAEQVVSTATITAGQWSHIAMTKTSSGITLFVNGKKQTTVAISGTPQSSTSLSLCIGQRYNTSINGYVNGLRIVKGTAVYTADFTPPTAPLTAITNTSLLLNFTNAGIYDSASGNDLETVGNAQVSTTQAKWGATSLAFDGTGDWLSVIDKPVLRLGTAAFTIEMWVYRSASGTYGLISKGTSTTGWSVSLNASNQVVFSFTSSSFNSTGTVAATTWTHIAVVREGTGTNQTKIYINGTNDGTGTVATDFNQTNAMYVGADRVAGGNFNGYLDDLRITNGVARYTANFTAPTAAFPLQ